MASLRRGSVGLLLAVLVVLAGCSGTIPEEFAPTDPGSGPAPEPTTATNGTLEVHYLNVGQSTSTLIVTPEGETMLIDTGHYFDDGEYVLEYLKSQGITRIDHLVTSHNDADHIGGHAAVIEYYETEADGIGAVYDPGIAASTETYEAYLDAVEKHDVTLYETREGDTIPFGNVSVAVLGPPEPYIDDRDRNENSIVLKLTYGSTSFLFSGDAEADQESYLVENYGDGLETTVLKAGHHGSASSSTEPFLDAAQPQAVVISSAYDSQYGHPHEEVLHRLADRSITTFWTATHGDVVLTTDGKNVTVATQRAAPTDPASLRDGDAIDPGATAELVRRYQITTDGTTAIDPDTASSPTDGERTRTDGAAATNGTLAVANIHANAEGDEYDNLNDEYVVFENVGERQLDISGWTIKDEAGHSYTVPAGVTIAAGETVTLRTGSGTDSETELFWGADSPIWDNNGDTVIVVDESGDHVLEEAYE